MRERRTVIEMFADYLAEHDSVAHAAAMLGKPAAAGWEMFRQICTDLDVPATYEGDVPPARSRD